MIVRPLVLLGTLATMIWAFFNPMAASWTFIVIFIAIFEGYTVLLYFADRRTPVEPFSPPYSFTPAEVDVVKRYYFFFRSPGLAREWSSAVSLIGLSTFLWAPWLLYREAWIQAAIIGVNFLLAGPMSLKLNPLPFLQKGAASGNNVPAALELEAVQSVVERIQSVRRAA